jgi:hypothetical protein
MFATPSRQDAPDSFQVRASMHRTKIDEDVMDLLFENAADFLNGGIQLLFSDAVGSRAAKMAVVSIQTSMELLAKFRLVEAKGMSTIVDGQMPTDLDRIRSGEFRSIGYRQAIRALSEIEALSDLDRELFDEAAGLRNKLVHFAGEVDVAQVRVACAHLAIRALNRFASAGWRDNGEFLNHCRLLSGSSLTSLTSFEPYRAEAVDSALDDPDTETVFRCWECKADALSLRCSGTYFCHCCGLSAQSHTAAYADCRFCGTQNAVVYDALNRSQDGHDGKCLHCDRRQRIRPEQM